MEIHFLGEKEPLRLDLASHTIVDKVYNFQTNISGGVYAGVSHSPFLEYITNDDIVGIVPLSSIRHIVFDKRFSKIKAIREKILNQNKQDEVKTR